MKRLKAYQVSDGEDMTVIRYAASSAAARREGGNEIGCEWDGIDSCVRKPEYDQYAPGPVPAQALIAAGWQFECRRHGCGNWANREAEELTFSAAGDPYCCNACMACNFARQRANAAACAALPELVEAKLPGCHVTEVYVYGWRLEAAYGGGMRAYVDFSFPGGRWPGRSVFGEEGFRAHGDDLPAFQALYAPPACEPPITEAV